MQVAQTTRIDTGKYHKRSETVNGDEQKGDEEALTQILNLPTVLQVLN
jgi:hypothetical protein